MLCLYMNRILHEIAPFYITRSIIMLLTFYNVNNHYSCLLFIHSTSSSTHVLPFSFFLMCSLKKLGKFIESQFMNSKHILNNRWIAIPITNTRNICVDWFVEMRLQSDYSYQWNRMHKRPIDHEHLISILLYFVMIIGYHSTWLINSKMTSRRAPTLSNII